MARLRIVLGRPPGGRRLSVFVLTEQTRYRVIGTVFLVAVAAVVLPMLLDGEGVESMHLDPVAPADFQVEVDPSPPPDVTPALEAREELAAEIDGDGYAIDTGARFGEPVLLEDATPDDTAATDAVPATDAAASGQPLAVPPPKWAVQVASFTQRENAVALRDRLVAAGRTAFLSNVKRGGEIVTRVAVGPFINRDDASKAKDDINRRHKMDAVVVRFTY